MVQSIDLDSVPELRAPLRGQLLGPDAGHNTASIRRALCTYFVVFSA